MRAETPDKRNPVCQTKALCIRTWHFTVPWSMAQSGVVHLAGAVEA
jgi:hypothetical protein